jgi:hypothetical protein
VVAGQKLSCEELCQRAGIWRGRLDGNRVIARRLDSLVKQHGSVVDLARLEAAAADVPGVPAACCDQVPDIGRIILAVEGPDQQSAAWLRRCLRPRLGNQRPDEILFTGGAAALGRRQGGPPGDYPDYLEMVGNG